MIATIDLGAFRAGSPGDRLAIARALGEACERIGFLHVCNHGVSDAVVAAARDAARRYFAQTTEQKLELRMRSREYRGYIPEMPFSEDRASGRMIAYEAFIFGQEPDPGEAVDAACRELRWPNRWPDAPAGFRDAVWQYWIDVTAVSRDLLRAFGLALGNDESLLLPSFERPMTNVSLLHYPASDPAAPPADARPHYDSNALTILLPGERGGLEAEHLEHGWVEVPPREGCFVVNIGNEMERWSGGRFRSTMHRVHPPAGEDRYSIGYFTSPGHGTVIEPIGPTAPGASTEPLSAGENFEAFIAQFDAIASPADAA